MDKTEPTREEILKTINKIIKEDFPCNWEFKEIAENDLLSDSNMDSFGYAMFWLNVQQNYNLRIKRKYKNEDEYTEKEYNQDIIKYVNRLDYKTYKVKHLINRIVRCS